ncbi:DNA-directed RNA polymerase subunit alpha [Patescibacteria group bacterium]|nr:DNA-directed RNA polymerase subunit alpha [Patescibacteria group bacterium]MBU2632981.1 DNA-directed RNA polymerase subunit alpha [Patescibacteria group bacterium]
MNYEIILPTKPHVVSEDGNKGVYEIGGLYAGYGHTLGNSLRRIILSSLPGASITTVKIDGVSHEFSTLEGVKEDVITILLNLKQIRFKLEGDEPQKIKLSARGQKKVKAGDLKIPAQITILNTDKLIATLTDKKSKLDAEITIEKGLGYVPREVLRKEKIDAGVIVVNAVFSPVRRINYEVENMRVGERTDYNKLRFLIETDGSISPREALENSIKILIKQLSAIVGISEKETEKIIKETTSEQKDMMDKRQKKKEEKMKKKEESAEKKKDEREVEEDSLKTRVEDLGLSKRTLNSLSKAGIRTAGGLARKREEELSSIDGIGNKAINEVRRALGNFGLILK